MLTRAKRLLAVGVFKVAFAVAMVIAAPTADAQLKPVWTKPIPTWHSEWAGQYLGNSEYEEDARDRDALPKNAPRETPW